MCLSASKQGRPASESHCVTVFFDQAENACIMAEQNDGPYEHRRLQTANCYSDITARGEVRKADEHSPDRHRNFLVHGY
jgi:hypothetical protein